MPYGFLLICVPPCLAYRRFPFHKVRLAAIRQPGNSNWRNGYRCLAVRSGTAVIPKPARAAQMIAERAGRKILSPWTSDRRDSESLHPRLRR